MTPGILPSALRASSAVRAAPAAQCPKSRQKVLLSNRGDPSPRPYGHFPVAPAMLGTANGAGYCTYAVHPWTALLRVGWDGARLLFAFALCCCFCGRMPPNGAPCGAASGRRKSPKGRAQDAREFAACTRMCIQRTPQPARGPAGQDARRARHLGGVSLVTFFAQALRRRSGANSGAGRKAAEGRMPGVKKVTRSAAGRVEALLLTPFALP